MNETTVCGTCGWVGYTDQAAGHCCNPRRIDELVRLVADLTRRLDAAERAFAFATRVVEGREMVTPGRPERGIHLAYSASREQAMASHPATRAAGPAPQVTGGAGRTAKRTPGRASYARVPPPRRAPAGGVA